MRARAMRRGAKPRSEAGAAVAAGRSSAAALVFLRGRDADSRLRERVAARVQARPVLGALAAAWLRRRGYVPLGFRCLGDWPRELDRRLRAAMAFLQEVDFEIGLIARRLLERKLYRELGLESFERYVEERLGLAPRTARRLVRRAPSARGGQCVPRGTLQSHPIRFRSACGPDAPSNRTTLCAHHHHRGVHAGKLAIRGRAPDGLIYTLGVGRFRSGDVIER